MEYRAVKFDNIYDLKDFLNVHDIKPTDIIGIYREHKYQDQGFFDLLYVAKAKSEDKPSEIAEKCGIQAQADGEYITQSAGDEIRQKNYDLISRQAVTDTTICDGISCNECSFNICEDGQPGCLLKERVDTLPSVKPQPKTGHWIRVTDKAGHLVWECDKCGWQQRFNTDYCPDCGCRMVEPQERSE